MFTVRFSLILILLGGCAAQTTDEGSDQGARGAGSEQCALHRATIQEPAPDAVVTGASADVRISWNPEPSREDVQVYDATGKAYQPMTAAADQDGAHVYHFVLPASSQFDLQVRDQCFVMVGPDNQRALALDLGSRQFSTGP
jgi:hypothetical protein